MRTAVSRAYAASQTHGTVMSETRYASDDGRFQVSVPSEQMVQMLSYCQVAQGKETGGVLAGYYLPPYDCAVVTEVSGPPADSRASRTRFQRGVRGLKQWLASLWNHSPRRYYLGEWHFHPYAAPHPSGDDCSQMREIAASPEYHCPEPLLMIVGGDPQGEWQLSAHVFVQSETPQSLVLQPIKALSVGVIRTGSERKPNV